MPDVASVPCPSCGEVNRIDGERLEQLHGHERHVGEVDRAAEGAREAARMAELTGSFGSGWAVAFVLSWLLAGIVTVAATPLAYVLALAIFAAPFVAAGVVSQRRLTRLRDPGRSIAAATVPVHCPTCGGQTELRPDAPVRACRYCSGALAADAPTLAALIASASARLRSEQRVATEQRWRLAAKQGRAPRTDLVPVFVFGGLGGLWVLGSVIATVRVLILDLAEPSPIELVIMNAISLLVIVGVGAPVLVRRRRLQRWRDAVERRAAEVGASVSTELAHLAEWLVAHWTGEFSGHDIRAALGYVFIYAEAPDAWAVSIAPLAHADAQVQPHLRVLVPGRPGSRLSEAAAALASAGFRVRIDEGGLIAEYDLANATSAGAWDGLEAAQRALPMALTRGQN